ncbi:site-specific integrase [Acidobacteria bacterium AB60]|nr:site-specific integrase [Acidobacteria bacterium AB60]
MPFSAFPCFSVLLRSSLMQDKLITSSHLSTDLEDLIHKANDLIRAAKAPSIRKAYQSDFRIFESWCTAHGLASLPSAPQTIALYIASCVVARLAPATIARRLASISKAHQAAGFEESPASTKHFVVGEVLKGARRTLGVAQKCKDPLVLNDICRLLAACPKNLRALILIGFAGAFRRSELCAMSVSDLCFSDSGLLITVPRSKADQEQAGERVAIVFGEHKDTCPIRALRQWLKAANVKESPVFRGVDRHGHVASTGLHRDSIAAIFKTAAARSGMNATNIAGHSVRAGMATQAALNGSSERAIARTTRHKSRRILRRYIRPGEMFRENASAALGL